MTIEGDVPEHGQPWLGAARPLRPGFLELLRSLDLAQRDPRVDGVLLRFEGGLESWSQAQSLRRSLARLREAGRSVAVWGESFKAGPAADAVAYMDWLANHAREPNMVERLTSARDLAITKLPQGQPHMSSVSHIRTPTAPFVFGGVLAYVERRRADAESLLARFDEQGIKLLLLDALLHFVVEDIINAVELAFRHVGHSRVKGRQQWRKLRPERNVAS